MLKAWLRFFRVVNLPTVPGDVLVGAAVAGGMGPLPVAAACLASVFLYMFGLADNDIVGANGDKDRPIPAGAISLRAARVARGLCLFAAMIVGAVANLPPSWWVAAFLLAVAVVVYNRTKWSAAMGVCRGLNVACGASEALAVLPLPVLPFVAGWTLYFAAVTKYSEGEETDPVKRTTVGMLIGGVIYLQLGALLLLYHLAPGLMTRNLLLAGAALLIVLRLMKRFLSEVSAS